MKKAMVGLSGNNTLKFQILRNKTWKSSLSLSISASISYKPLGNPFIVLLALLEPDIPPLPHDPPRALSGIYICVPKPLRVNKAPQKKSQNAVAVGCCLRARCQSGETIR